MVIRISLFCLVLIVFISSCKNDDDPVSSNEPNVESMRLAKITAINQNNSFVDAKGDVFFPWGYNYTNPEIIGLIEDNWSTESTWDIIKEDFVEMKGYAANIVRVHLQYNKFMIDADTPDPMALQRLQRLVKIAEDTGLYLDITGLAAYRKSDSPVWYDNLSDTERWETHAIFWRNIAGAVGDSEAVFAFNLMNEPVVAVGCDGTSECEWSPGNDFGGFHFIQNIARDSNLTFDEGIRNWTTQLTAAIREEDPTTMITVGFLGLGPISRFADDYDYLSLHTYPKSGEIQVAVDRVINSTSNKPLILEETGNLHCTIPELQSFISQIDGHYDGLMGHYFGKTLEEMQASGTFVDANHKNLVEFIIANDPN